MKSIPLDLKIEIVITGTQLFCMFLWGLTDISMFGALLIFEFFELYLNGWNAPLLGSKYVSTQIFLKFLKVFIWAWAAMLLY